MAQADFIPEGDGGGGGGVGGGASAPPAGGGTSSAPVVAAASPGLSSQLAGVGTHDYPMLQTGTEAIRGPGRTVLPGEIVLVSAIPNNSALPDYVAIATAGPDAAKSGPNRRVLTPGSQPVEVSVRRLNEIWMYSTQVNQGVVISVRKKG